MPGRFLLLILFMIRSANRLTTTCRVFVFFSLAAGSADDEGLLYPVLEAAARRTPYAVPVHHLP